MSLKRVGEQVEVHLVSDTLSETEGTLHLRLIGRDGLIASEKQTAAVAPANAAQKITTFSLTGEPPSLALYAAFVGDEGTILNENLLLLTEPKVQEWQELPDRELRIDIETTGDGTATLSVKSTHFGRLRVAAVRQRGADDTNLLRQLFFPTSRKGTPNYGGESADGPGFGRPQ